jgi:hypothetical protein
MLGHSKLSLPPAADVLLLFQSVNGLVAILVWTESSCNWSFSDLSYPEDLSLLGCYTM